jgi:hypothetical protein
MPFIRGRYHINAVAGEALEAAREAEAALLALQHDAQAAEQDGGDDSDGEGAGNGAGAAAYARGPIHRVEIEAAEMVPAHSGRGERGFVARVHRAIPAAVDAQDDGLATGAGGVAASRRPGTNNLARVVSTQPETHVFAGHRDLLSFLRDEFAKDCKQ